MESVVKSFDELTKDELYEIIKKRIDVFVVEQNCPYPELDGIDRGAHHVFLREDGVILAYLRVYCEGNCVRIGRVLSVKRRQGLGTRVLREGIRVATEVYLAEKIVVEAQTYVKEMYEKLGFVQCSEEFTEDGILHIKMVLDTKIHQQ